MLTNVTERSLEVKIPMEKNHLVLTKRNTSLRHMAKGNLGIFCLLKRVDLICMSSQTMLHLY